MVAEEHQQRRFEPSRYESFRFVARELDGDGRVRLHYALDEEIAFVEELELPLTVSDAQRERVDGLLSLLHWVAGVSYYKSALPTDVRCETGAPGPDATRLLEALYSEGLGELAVTNGLPRLPRPRFGAGRAPAAALVGAPVPPVAMPARALVPVGGGKDSIVALEIVRRAGIELSLFSIGDPAPISRTAAAAALPRLTVGRRIDATLLQLNRDGAINGHVPVTAIVSCVALLVAALAGFDTVVMANERSASAPNLAWDGIEVNHQFSKSLLVERLLRAAARESDAGVDYFSVLRPASELAIARAFSRLERYHDLFTSCNSGFRLDEQLPARSWCGDCPKCRFVFLALAPFSEPERLRAIFGADLLDDDRQFEGFALLAASGGHKPFECVGEEQESIAAMRMLARDPRWSGHRVVERLVREVLPQFTAGAGDPAAVLELADDHDVPAGLMGDVRALLGA